MIGRPIAAASLAIACLAASATAHVVSDRELVTLRALPAGAVRRLLAAEFPDTSGRVGANAPSWRHLRLQTPALYLLAEASARSDTALAERVWASLELALAHQQPSGEFEHGRVAEATLPFDDRAQTVAWLGEACRALVALMNSDLADRFRWRYSLMLPKLKRSLDRAVATAAEREDAQPRRVERLLADAQAFLLADGIYHDEAYGRAGQRAIASALALQRADGLFAGDDSRDPVTQARVVSHLQAVTQYFPAPSLESALTRAAKALAAQVRPTGALRARSPEPGAQRIVALALLLYAQRAGDSELAALAERMRGPRRPDR